MPVLARGKLHVEVLGSSFAGDKVMSEFVEKWQSLEQIQQEEMLDKAKAEAEGTLNNHKKKTGVAILGTPPRLWLKTPSFQKKCMPNR